MKDPEDQKHGLDSNLPATIEQLPVYERIEQDHVGEDPPLQSATLHSSTQSFGDTDQIITTNDDGRIDLHVDEDFSNFYRRFSLGPLIEKPQPQDETSHSVEKTRPPTMNFLMLVVGSRGDVQPFIALGQALQMDGHRVRIATHPHFQSFVEAHDLEFFDIGGNPAELMAYMVRNPGLVPKFAALRQGEIQKRRRSMKDIVYASWRACFEAGRSSQKPPSYNRSRKGGEVRPKQGDPKPFVADAILANPPSLAHVHCAEKLGIPVHILFTMPWWPTQSFPHPLANVKTSDKNIGQINYLSYFLVESIIWQGLGSIINRFRYKVLELDPIHPSRAPAMLQGLHIPHTFCWSASLLPKPADWHSNVAVSGYLFDHGKKLYSPPIGLLRFLEAGPPPLYIGFGSIVVDDTPSLTSIVVEAVRKLGQRAIISAGWSNLGQSKESSASSDVFMLHDSCPHDWLFPQVSCVVHHGGAGTTAAGLKAGRPTIIVPFFGDQFFWGDIVHRAGAGPRRIPYRSLTAIALAEAMAAASHPDVLSCAAGLGERIADENGAEQALQNIYANLPIGKMTCALVPSRVAAWKSKSTGIQLSAVAATVLRKEKLVDWNDLVLHRPMEHHISKGPFEPISGAAWAVTELLYDSFRGMGEILAEVGHTPMVVHRTVYDLVTKHKQSSGLDDDDTVSNFRVAVTDKVSIEHPVADDQVRSRRHKFMGEYMLTGALRVGKAAARAPGTFTASMAQGAHNMPQMWGDTKVRPAAKVTGIGSGAVEGCKELVLGVYDGISGVFTQPVYGLIEDGPTGFVKGVGKGVLGLPVKFFAAANGIVGYPLKGIDVALSHALSGDGMKAVRNQRMLQGEHEYVEISEQTKKEIVARWQDTTANPESSRRKIRG